MIINLSSLRLKIEQPLVEIPLLIAWLILLIIFLVTSEVAYLILSLGAVALIILAGVLRKKRGFSFLLGLVIFLAGFVALTLSGSEESPLFVASLLAIFGGLIVMWFCFPLLLGTVDRKCALRMAALTLIGGLGISIIVGFFKIEIALPLGPFIFLVYMLLLYRRCAKKNNELSGLNGRENK